MHVKISTLTGNQFSFRSVEEFDAAAAWFDNTPLSTVFKWCEDNQVEVRITPRELLADWAYFAMFAYSRIVVAPSTPA